MRNFRSLVVWQKGMSIVTKTYDLTAMFPNEEKYGLKSQMCRAAVSVPSNIAEGCSRGSDKDFVRFLEIALGSLFELETQLLLVQELNYSNQESVKLLLSII
ncbi:four helix bundle protein [Labilibaculum manganireducens]|uniref:Four helix bundle protein n=1 Tax=Labilibaculum manganireducens TaxID=1940525 RepID=A0A2N3ICV6_9BACT|nr:four helix bundle protein [Labilibaculum manganireducens]PKQ68115.1 four helix bundle protein [Labilibaculum manganireducens]